MRQKAPCPGCAEKDTSGNNLLLYEDSETQGYCFQCRASYSTTGEKVQQRYDKKPKDDGLEMAAIHSYPIRALHDGLIPVEVAEHFGVRCAVSEETGDPAKVYYPYYEDTDLTGYKIRTLPTKGFAIVGKINSLFGQNVAKKGAKMLTIVEGEKDCLAVYTMQQKKGKNYNVVSLPNGANLAGTIDQATRNNIEFITSHALVVIFLDSDKPGQQTALALAELICSNCRVKIINTAMKDAFELLEAGEDEQFWKALYAPDFHPQKIVRGSEISLEQLRKPKAPGYSLPYPKLNAKLQGLRKGEIALVTGGSGLGKTAFVRELGYHLATVHNLTVANIMLETPYEDVARSYIAMDNGVPPYKLIFNPNAITEEAYESSRIKLFESNKFHFFAHWGSLDAEMLVQKCAYFVKALGADFIILDHISLAVAGQDTDERKTLDMAFEALTRLCVETGVGVIVVMHLKRVQGKNWGDGAEVDLTDLRGTAGAEQMSWSVIAVERNSKDEATKDVAKIRLIKNRTTGFLGVCDSLTYSHETGRLTVLNQEY